jgi:rod shape-determining protein MreB
MNLGFIKNIKKILFKEDIIIDIGSKQVSFSNLYSNLMFKEQSLIAVEYHDSHKSIVAFGNDARDLAGKESENIKVISPVKEGKIEDRLMTENLVKQIIEKHNPESFLKLPPKVFMLVPTNISEVDMEQRESLMASVGAREIQIVNNLLASAIGMGGDIGNEKGVMVLDIGGESIQCGIVKLNKIINSRSFDFGVGELDKMIVKTIREKYKIAIGLQTAENLKKEIGMDTKHKEFIISGKDILKNIPIERKIESRDIVDVFKIFLDKIVIVIKKVFEDMPEEISADINSRGIMICGGGSQLKNLKESLNDKLHLKIEIAKDEFVSIVGAKIIWKNMNNETIINYDE